MNEKNLDSTHVNEENVITSEGVSLKIEPLNLPMRIGAFLIDYTVMIILCFISFLTIVKYSDFFILNDKSYQILLIVILSSFLFFIPIFIEFFTSGYSLGKYIVGARVLRDDGGVVYFRHIFTRHIIGVIENFTFGGVLSSIVIASNKRGKRIGDFLAGTYVAKLPSYNSNLPLVMPDDFKDWAKKVTLYPIPILLLKDAKIFINRASNMSIETRKELADHICNALIKCVDLHPEGDFDKERFIVAVLVLKRDKDFRKVLRNNK